MSSRPVDIAIVGAGPAGLSTAIHARRQGLSVTAIDSRTPPIDKACGEGLMPDGAAELENLGVPIARLDCRPFHGIRYVDGSNVADARFPGRPGLGIRRTVLHEALVRQAEEVGVQVRWGETAVGLDPGGVRTRSGIVAARYTVGADGLRSPVRRLAGLAGREIRPARFGIRRHYRIRPWTDRVEVHWGDGCEAYVTPVAADCVGVAVLYGGQRPDAEGLGPFPVLAGRLRGAEVVSSERGAGPLEQRVRLVARGRVALVGDAAGYVDAITGEGLSVALHQARALVNAVVDGNLDRYVREHRRIVVRPNTMTRLLLAIERRPALRRRVVGALASEPGLFARLLAIHTRDADAWSLGLGGATRLAWRVIAHVS